LLQQAVKESKAMAEADDDLSLCRFIKAVMDAGSQVPS
jgi:hypothetical protein